MSWFLKRARALAKTGWWETFNRSDENPIRQPWGTWGGAPDMQLVGNRLFLADTNGGVGWEFQALTPNWGFEFSADWTVRSTSTTYAIYAYIGDNWTITAGDQARYVMQLSIENQHSSDSDVQRVRINQVDRDDFWNFGSQIAGASLGSSSSTFGGPWPHKIRVRFFEDTTLVLWVDDVMRAMGTVKDLPSKPGPGRRAINFAKRGTRDAYVDDFAIYDFNEIAPTWSSLFYDDFNRANGAPANGWTFLGSNGGIVSNAFAVTAGLTSDGGRAIIRNTGITNGKMRVEGVLKSPTAHEQALILHSNAAGTQGLAVRVSAGNAVIYRFSSVLSGNPPTWTQLGVTITPTNANGQAIAFETRGDGTARVWKGTELLAYAENVFAVVAQSNSYAGEFVSRSAFVSSGAWDDCRILQAA